MKTYREIEHSKTNTRLRDILPGFLAVALLFLGAILISTVQKNKSEREATRYNDILISEFTFLGPHAEELGTKINTLLREHRTQVPTGSIALHGNLMWLRTPEGKTPYGLAVQFQTGAGVYVQVLSYLDDYTYIDKAVDGILYDIGLTDQYRRMTPH